MSTDIVFELSGYLKFMAVTLPDIRIFVLGILTGFVLLTLMIALLLVSGRRKRKKILMSREAPLDSKTVEAIVEEKQKELVDTVKFTDNAYFRVAIDLSMELMQEISHHYFPRFQIPDVRTVDPGNHRSHILCDKKGSRRSLTEVSALFKNARISTIINILEEKSTRQFETDEIESETAYFKTVFRQPNNLELRQSDLLVP